MFQAVPNPAAEDFARRVFEAFNVIEVVVIKALDQRLARTLYLTEVHDPAGMGIGFAAYIDAQLEGMTVQSRALVPRGHIREPVRGLKVKVLVDFHAAVLQRVARFAAQHGLRCRSEFYRAPGVGS